MTQQEYARFKHSEWRNANPERARELRRSSYARNRDAIRERLRERYASDPAYRAAVLEKNRRSYQNRKGG